MNCRKHCTLEKREIIKKKMSSERKSYSEIIKLLDCCNKMIINALRHEPKVESCGRKRCLLKRLTRTTKSNPFMPATELKSVGCASKRGNYSPQATRQQS